MVYFYTKPLKILFCTSFARSSLLLLSVSNVWQYSQGRVQYWCPSHQQNPHQWAVWFEKFIQFLCHWRSLQKTAYNSWYSCRSVKVLEGAIWKDMSQVESSTPSIVPATRQCQSHTCLTCLVVTRVWRPWHSLLLYQHHLALLALLTHTGQLSPAAAAHLPP